MKKLILILVCSLIGLSSYAQFGSGVKIPLAIGDTLGKGAGTTQVNKFISATGGYSGATVQVVLSKQTGTPAGGISLYQSTDGVTYDRLLPSSAADSLVLGASSISYTWKITGPLSPKIKVHATNSGTQNTLISVWYTLRKYQTN